MGENDAAMVIVPGQETGGERKYLFALFASYILGAVVGALYCEQILRFASADMVPPQSAYVLIRCFLPVFLLMFFSMSVIGWGLIALVFFASGFSDCATVYLLFANGYSTLQVCLTAGIPAMLTLTALFSMGVAALQKALSLRRLCAGTAARQGPGISASRMIAACLLIVSAVLIQKYLMLFHM